MPAPTTLPVWATDPEALIVTPSTAKQQQGWTTGTNTPQGQGEKPPLQFFNWYQNLVYQWIQYLSTAVGNLPTFGTMATQNANAVDVTGGTINGTNINTILAALGTLANQNANAVNVSGGAINDTVIGLATPAAAAFTKAVDSGAAPTAASQLTNKQYVDGTLTPGTFNGQDYLYVQLPGGLVAQVFYGAYSGGSSGEVANFPHPFPNKCIRVLANDIAGAHAIGTSVNPSSPASQFVAFTQSQTVDANVIAIGY